MMAIAAITDNALGIPIINNAHKIKFTMIGKTNLSITDTNQAK